MTDSFGRRVALVIGTTEGGAARRIEGLRVAFRVIMTSTSLPFEASIDVWNPSDSTVSAARDPAAQVILEAGYQQIGAVFRGEPIPGGVRAVRRGSDRVLTIEAADAWKARASAWFDRSYDAQTRAAQVVTDAAAALGVDVGAIVVPGDLRWPRGVAFAGPASEALDEIAESVGASWYIDGGALYFGADGQPVVAERGPLITSTTGMVGSPTLRSDGGGDVIEVRSLLLPRMRPGRPFRVRSEAVRGDFVAREVQHVGDSGWDQPFYSEILGVPR